MGAEAHVARSRTEIQSYELTVYDVVHSSTHASHWI